MASPWGVVVRARTPSEIGSVSRVYDDEGLASAYEHGNEMPEESLRAWVELIASYTRCPSPSVVDIGAGTGVPRRDGPLDRGQRGAGGGQV